MGQLFYRVSLNLSLSIFLTNERRMRFSRTVTEMMLCSSHCLLSGGTRFQLVPVFWVRLMLIADYSGVCQASQLTKLLFFSLYFMECYLQTMSPFLINLLIYLYQYGSPDSYLEVIKTHDINYSDAPSAQRWARRRPHKMVCILYMLLTCSHHPLNSCLLFGSLRW